MRIKFWIVFVSLALAVQGFAASVEREFEREYDLDRDGIVNVKNVNGELVVKSWNDDKVRIYAEIKVKSGSHRKAEDFMDKVKIEVKRHGDEISIEPDYPKRDDGGFMDMLFSNKKPSVTVDFTISVPREATVNARSVNGAVKVTDIGGLAELKTVNGGITAKGMGNSVSANTTNGGISVEIDESLIRQEMDFHTVNGSIKLYLRDDIGAYFNLSTVNGSIRTDFPIKMSGDIDTKRIQGKINDGGPEIKMKTVNGSISIQEL